MPEANILASFKDLAPSSAAILGIVLISYYLVQMIKTFAERHMKFMDRLIEILDKHSNVISGVTSEMHSNGEIISAHTSVIRQFERSMETTARFMERIEKTWVNK